MSHRLRLSIIALTVLGLGVANSTHEETQAAIDAPLTKVGKDLASWVQYFGDDYKIVDLDTSKNLHNSDPMVSFWITDGFTTVRFAINLVTNDQYISEIESVSGALLDYLEIDRLPFDSNGNVELERCWDAGCNRLRVHREQSGRLGAVWNYYLD